MNLLRFFSVAPLMALVRLLGYSFLGWFWLGVAVAASFFTLRISIPMVIFLFVFFNLARAHARARTGREVLLRLHDTVAMNLPLPHGLGAMANGEKGKLRRRLRTLSEACAHGTPLAQALKKSVPEVGPRDLGLIGAGDRAGRLGPVLSRMATRCERPSGLGMAVTYALSFTLIMMPLMMVVWMAVGPKYGEILRQYTTTTPFSIQVLTASPDFIQAWFGVRTADIPNSPIWLYVLYGSGLALALAAPGLLWWWADERFDSLQSFGSTLAWKCPVLGRLIRERAWADACLLLSESLRAGEDLPMALGNLNQAGLPWPATRRFRLMHRALLAGASPGDAARTAGLPAAMTGLLGMPNPELATMLDEAERLYRLRFDALAFAVRELAKPAVIVFFGVLVGLFAWACVDGQVKIMESLENSMFGGAL